MKIREALTKIRDTLMNGGFNGRRPAHFVNICDAALAAPPRNCDTMSAGECKQVFSEEMLLHLTSEATENEKKLILITAHSVIDCLFAPATEKGATV